MWLLLLKFFWIVSLILNHFPLSNATSSSHSHSWTTLLPTAKLSVSCFNRWHHPPVTSYLSEPSLLFCLWFQLFLPLWVVSVAASGFFFTLFLIFLYHLKLLYQGIHPFMTFETSKLPTHKCISPMHTYLSLNSCLRSQMTYLTFTGSDLSAISSYFLYAKIYCQFLLP